MANETTWGLIGGCAHYSCIGSIGNLSWIKSGSSYTDVKIF